MAICHKDTEIVRILESKVKLDKERVVNGRQDLLLSAHILDLLLLDDVTLVQDLHCKWCNNNREF